MSMSCKKYEKKKMYPMRRSGTSVTGLRDEESMESFCDCDDFAGREFAKFDGAAACGQDEYTLQIYLLGPLMRNCSSDFGHNVLIRLLLAMKILYIYH